MVNLRKKLQFVCVATSLAMILTANAAASKGSKSKTEPLPPPPELLLSGGRKLVYERSFSSQREVKPKRGFWNKLVDVIAGAPDYRSLVRPYSVVADSRGRLIITDPGIPGVHVFDFNQQKYKFIQREGKEAFLAPQCVAVDAEDNFYVTDSEAGKIFVFDNENKFRRVIGSIKGGEGYFKRPTGIAVDSVGQRIFVSDTLRHKIFVLDMQGSILKTIGQNGAGDGEFNFPTELRWTGTELLVVTPETAAAPCSAPRGLASTASSISTSSTHSGTPSRCLIVRVSCSITSARAAMLLANSTFPLDCSSIIRMRFT